MHKSICLRLSLAGAAWAFAAAAGAAELVGSAFGYSEPLFAALNPPFTAQWDQAHPQDPLRIQIQTGTLGKDALSAIRAGKIDLVVLSQPVEMAALSKTGGPIAPDWSSRLPHAGSPFYSTLVFLVRKGNPRKLKEWSDLARDDVSVVLSSPLTTSVGRYAYLAAWQAAEDGDHSDRLQTLSFMRRFLANAKVAPKGIAQATQTFMEQGSGDVLVTFESFARMLKNQYAADGYEVVTPSASVMVPFSVAWVDKSVKARGTGELAQDYLKYLYSPAAQKILVDFSYRVYDAKTLAAYPDIFPALKLFRVEEHFGSWDAVMRDQFAPGGIYERLLAQVKKQESARSEEAKQGAKEAARRTEEGEKATQESAPAAADPAANAASHSTESAAPIPTAPQEAPAPVAAPSEAAAPQSPAQAADALAAPAPAAEPEKNAASNPADHGPVRPVEHDTPAPASVTAPAPAPASAAPAAAPEPSAPAATKTETPNPSEQPSETAPQSQLTRPVTSASKTVDAKEADNKAQSQLLRPAAPVK